MKTVAEIKAALGAAKVNFDRLIKVDRSWESVDGFYLDRFLAAKAAYKSTFPWVDNKAVAMADVYSDLDIGIDEIEDEIFYLEKYPDPEEADELAFKKKALEKLELESDQLRNQFAQKYLGRDIDQFIRAMDAEWDRVLKEAEKEVDHLEVLLQEAEEELLRKLEKTSEVEDNEETEGPFFMSRDEEWEEYKDYRDFTITIVSPPRED